MSTFTSEEVSKRLVDFSIMMKYMPFLQEHGFSEFGKGQLSGKMELLKESFSDSHANRIGPQFDVPANFNQIDATPTPDYEELRVKASDLFSIEGSSNLGESVNKMLNSTGVTRILWERQQRKPKFTMPLITADEEGIYLKITDGMSRMMTIHHG